MVKKIAVMAVVLIVAIPILLGYGLAFEEVEKTTWNESNTRSITSVLYNDVKYSDIALNTYAINSKIYSFLPNGNSDYPIYMKVASAPVTSLPIGSQTYTSVTAFVPGNFGTGFVYFDNDSPVTATVNYVSGGSPATDSQSIGFLKFDGTSVTLKLYGASSVVNHDNVTSITFNEDYTVQYEPSSGSYADITYGWTFKNTQTLVGDGLHEGNLNLGTFTRTILTMDLGELLESIPAGESQMMDFTPIGDKSPRNLWVSVHRGSTVGESYLDVWVIGGSSAIIPLDDSDFSKNVYQLMFDRSKYELRYIGSWPNVIAPTQSLATWSFDYKYSGASATYFNSIEFNLNAPGAFYGIPIFRFDSAIREGYPSPVITDKTYDPSVLMPDSVTGSYSISLADIGYTGTSIGWGGQTFEVNKGAIIVDHKRIALSNLTLESKYLNGMRTNYINGNEISTGANTLQMNGTWGAIVSLTELTPETSTSNEWQPGEFAWNGVDSSFALMGLIASVGVFVGLGMYGKRSGAKVGMLMLICGGAALIFLALI